MFQDSRIELAYLTHRGKRTRSASVLLSAVLGVAWLSALPRLLLGPLKHLPRIQVVMAVWLCMGCLHLCTTYRLARCHAWWSHEAVKTRAALVNIAAAMVCIILLRKNDAGLTAAVPVALVQSGLVVFYQVRWDTGWKLHCLNLLAFLYMVAGNKFEGQISSVGDLVAVLLQGALFVGAVPILLHAQLEVHARAAFLRLHDLPAHLMPAGVLRVAALWRPRALLQLLLPNRGGRAAPATG